ncbi:acyl-CoA dehydrogenase [Wenxinia marina]|uniref:Acyl-CoA dehydrogenase n=1 Tax=Wenxinia marina DSM 24838 TaxID=1123501 RepID=A0A0D0P9W4_9RHOB|nr:acyl-CoA dehydrogenase family protein [Wenxinia marina]KIQ68301.1 Acyl-CoA dehydrogenase [Wenxinia marina DSM 24838]GGL79599.1 hypothetical protein GCM10011392_37510 [Wenxinia marina]
MRLVPTEAQVLLRDTLRRRLESPPADLWPALAEMGLLGLALPEAHGGASPAEIAVVAEELGRAVRREPWIATCILAAPLIAALGTKEQQAALLPEIAAGRVRPALAHDENPAGALATRAAPDSAGWRLSGTKPLIPGGAEAGLFLVTAATSAGPALFLVRPGAPGLTLTPCQAVDGPAADLTLAGTPAERLGDADPTDALSLAHDRANAAACADAVGTMDALLAATIAHLTTREQFGKPLSAFQALRHRVAEMAVMCREARASTLLATLSVHDPATRARAVSGARAKVGRLARQVAHEAIQLHGAMGVTEELPLGRALRRLYAFERRWGTTDGHLSGYADALDPVVADGLVRAGPADDEEMNLEIGPADAAFGDEVRAFLSASLPDELHRAERLTPGFLAEPAVGRRWQAILAAKGWAAPAWPAEHGGPGWSLTRRYLFDQECERAGEPHFRSAGLKMLAPVLMRYGTKDQQARHLPGILSGADLWAQGYSEPGAGSDLASLKTRAVRDGDDYVVTGTKIWTTHAHAASRMFALVRTSDEGKRQAGLSFLLIAMDAPGVTVRPITSIDGSHEFNQVFLDGVRVPVAERVGDEGQGWQIARYLLEFERGGSFAGGLLRALHARAHRLLAAPGPAGRPFDDPLVRARFARIGTDIDANDMLELTALGEAEAGGAPGAVAASVMKIERSRIRQAIAELTAHAAGDLRWEPHRPLHDLPPEDPLDEARKVAVPAYLASRAQSIFGGTNEIQLEIIARALLG